MIKQKQISDKNFLKLLITTTLLFVGISQALLTTSVMPYSEHEQVPPRVPAIRASVVDGTVDDPRLICTLTDVTCADEARIPHKDIVVTQQATVNKNVIVAPESFKTTAEKTCLQKGLGTQCVKDLLAMAYVETQEDPYNCNLVGDQGRSYGCLMIQIKMHNVSKSAAKDFTFASQWALNRMMEYGYPTYRIAAIRAHNGSGAMADRYAQKVKRIAMIIE